MPRCNGRRTEKTCRRKGGPGCHDDPENEPVLLMGCQEEVTHYDERLSQEDTEADPDVVEPEDPVNLSVGFGLRQGAIAWGAHVITNRRPEKSTDSFRRSQSDLL